ncbi:alpha/beta hydrolase [Tenggerimyces flavus]|uniref:Alpha/beta hydrolase n=1 Tax=Tenggerimyces flavus TaxID=1708749 RepID=A0ABV7Y911_9ACTN|nr:alpha/beta hydrolase family protein [Tenggerimyces flavus]MBM7786592.1 S-formylglutathione hydrolase FrmB [Tenggerimyces flavus]
MARSRSIVLALLLAFLLALGLVAPATAAPAKDRARVVKEEWVAERQLDLTVDSPALGKAVKVRLLTPDGWRKGTHKSWPTFYLLHGCCGDYTSWTALTDVAETKALRKTLVVMPEAGNVGWYSDWWNGGNGGTPKWETFHLTELRRLLEREYGAGHKRVVAGLSMGGFGALSYAARHPGKFRAAASYSGVVNPIHDAQFVLNLNAAFGEDPLALWGDPIKQRRIWNAHDPLHLARKLRHTPVFLASGNGQPGPFDDPNRQPDALEQELWEQNVLVAKRLKELRAPLVTDLYGPGTHSWPYWERELHRSLPLLLGALR